MAVRWIVSPSDTSVSVVARRKPVAVYRPGNGWSLRRCRYGDVVAAEDAPEDDPTETSVADELDTEFDDDSDRELEPIDIDNPDPVETARRRYGRGGGILAAGMFGLDKALTGKVKPDDMVQVQEAATEPIDLDKDGFQLTIDDSTTVEAPAMERRPPLVSKKKPRR